jgi:cell division protein FtsL
MRASGAIRVALAFAALLASLSLVVYRQSRALDVLRDLDGLRSARAVAESERAVLSAKAQELESRARIKAVAEARWGMRVPASGELVTLLAPVRTPAARVAAAEVR